MSLKQTVYFMALVGAIAGLCCWFVQSWIASLLVGSDLSNAVQAYESVWISALMGALIGGLTVAFADHWTADRVVFRWALVAVLLGSLAGAIAGVLYLPILSVIDASRTRFGPLLGRTLTWTIAGGLIGLATGLRWFGVNRLRSVHALLGGLLGGAIGGAIFTLLGSSDEVFQAIAFMITGMGITLGVTLAPVLLRDGVLQFISSGEGRAQNKYGSSQQEWVIQEGDRFIIGKGSDRNRTVFARPVDVLIPDAMMSPCHAVLFANARRFYIEPHRDNVGLQGHPLSPLQINQVNVVGSRELHDGDVILMGQTLLRFFSKRQPVVAVHDPVAARRS